MSDMEAFRVAFKADLEEFAADIADGFERYHAIGDPACRMEGVIEQLFAVLNFVERWVDPPVRLVPLREHLNELIDRHMSRHGNGRDPTGVTQTMRRANAVTLMQLEFEAQGRKDEGSAARKAVAAFSGVSASQIISWRKRAQAKEPPDPALKMVVKQCLEFWEEPTPKPRTGGGFKTGTEIDKRLAECAWVYPSELQALIGEPTVIPDGRSSPCPRSRKPVTNQSATNSKSGSTLAAPRQPRTGSPAISPSLS